MAEVRMYGKIAGYINITVKKLLRLQLRESRRVWTIGGFAPKK